MTKQAKEPIAYCSFCGCREDESPALVMGPAVNICGDCISRALEITAGRIETYDAQSDEHFKVVFERDDGRCVYCCRDLMTDFESFMSVDLDLLVSRIDMESDTDEVSNIVTSCTVCCRLRGLYTPGFGLTDSNRTSYIEDIRNHIMKVRALKMASFASRTPPGSSNDR